MIPYHSNAEAATASRALPMSNTENPMAAFLLFVVSCVMGGLGGALGSIVGHAAGPRGLWIGGIVGGILGAIAGVAIARQRHWLTAAQFPAAAVGASVGFLLAAAIAVNTLSSPVGPILSTGLIGLGALLGARISTKQE
jgi:hypothetical protein